MLQPQAYDFIDQKVLGNPHPFYAQLRASRPLYPYMLQGEQRAWIVTNYALGQDILKDPRFVKDQRHTLNGQEQQKPRPRDAELLSPLLNSLISMDPPDHTRMRHLISKAFTPRMIEQLRPRIQQITDELLDALEPRGAIDLISDFAFPLPITVISEMLGIPSEDRQQIRSWSSMLNTGLDPSAGPFDVSAETINLINYLRTFTVHKRLHPGDDLTSSLAQVEEGGDKISENELTSMLWLLIFAGHETTVNLIGNGTLALLQHPEQMRMLQRDLSLVPSAVEEFLRYTAPVTTTPPRWASEDIVIGGESIKRGELVFVSLVGADTDPEQFAEPERLDITRAENRHIAFGKGIHYCLGAPLARLEAQIAFTSLLQRLPNLRLAVKFEELTWRPHISLRSLSSLPVTF